MRRAFFIAAVVVAVAAARTGSAQTPIVDPTSVRAGQVGVCVTELDGGERVEIPLTILGVVGGGGPEREIVLARLEGERIEHTGIIAGMSGSPVYVDGRLLGALAFAWPFAKEPIAGITPFARMERLADEPVRGPEPVSSLGRISTGRPALADLVDWLGDGTLGDRVVDWLLPERRGRTLHHLPVVVAAGGVDLAGGGWLSTAFSRLGWMGVPAASGVSVDARGEIGAFAAGDMVAAVLVSGDVTLAAGGTVTEVRGEELWAFGHPFLGGGAVTLPLARARAVAVMPSQASSFKFFAVGETVGTFLSDRQHGIWGKVGASAPTVPVTVTVNGREYDFSAANHPTLLPLLAAYLSQSSVAARGRTFGDQTVWSRVHLDWGADGELVVPQALAGADAPAATAAWVAALLGYLQASPLPTPKLESVRVEIATDERLRSVTLEAAVPVRRIVAPGDELEVRLSLRPHGGETFTRRVVIQVPESIPGGRLDLVIADGASWTAYDLRMRPQAPDSFSDQLRLVRRLRPATDLVLVLEDRDLGLATSAGPMSAPPSLVFRQRAAIGDAAATTSHRVVRLVAEDLGVPVTGGVRIPLEVRTERRPGSEGEER